MKKIVKHPKDSGSRLLTSGSPFDITSLKRWFLREKRDLPWRLSEDPYAVWISEVMLQQTQVAVVIPYFERWMSQFPTIQSLAEARLDDVIKCWEGLGYYSRARHLHAGAQYVLDHFCGTLPSDPNQLQRIKGLGPYTIGAIRSFAFHQKTSAVDGNVLRVLSRYFMIKDDVSKPSTVKMVRDIAEAILPDEESWIFNEGLIELGAVVCGRKPRCQKCPLKGSCLSHAHGVEDQIPYKSAKIKTELLYRAVPVIISQGRWLVNRGEKGKIMSDLHEFPFFETAKEGVTTSALGKEVKSQLGLEATLLCELPEVTHSFTRYQVRLNPVLFSCPEPAPVQGLSWKSLEELRKLAFSSGHRRIFQLAVDSPQLV
jgi:A/G-specific adenine glycosylase